MLAWAIAVGEMRRRADAADLHIVAFVAPVRRVMRRQVGNGGEFGLERRERRLLARLHLGHGCLQRGDLFLQRLGGCGVLARHRLADFPRGGVAALLRLLQLADGGAPLVVERDQRLRERGETAAREPGVECFRIVPDRLDVMHRSELSP